MKIRIILAVLVCVFVTAPLLAQGPPDFSGPIVVRYDDTFYYWGYFDEKRGYVAFHGVDVLAACSGDPLTEWSEWSFKEVSPRGEDGVLVQQVKGYDVLTSVWPMSILDDGLGAGQFCPKIVELGAPIAEGTADVIIKDNDLYAFLYDHHRSNAFSLSAHGMLEDPIDGETMVFNGGYNCVWDGENEAKCKNKNVLH